MFMMSLLYANTSYSLHKKDTIPELAIPGWGINI